MTDEVTTTTEETVEEAPNPGLEYLNTAPVDELLKNDRFRGILGSRIQQEREATERRITEQSQARAREEAQAELDQLAATDEYAFSQKYLSKRQQEKIAADLATLKSSTRTEFAQALGRGFQSLPETKELTPAEQETIARALVGVSDDDAVVAFNAAMIDVIAERRASVKNAKYREQELAKEVQATREEDAAKRLKGSARPTLTRTNGDAKSADWQSLPPGKDFDAAYDKFVLGRGR